MDKPNNSETYDAKYAMVAMMGHSSVSKSVDMMINVDRVGSEKNLLQSSLPLFSIKKPPPNF